MDAHKFKSICSRLLADIDAFWRGELSCEDLRMRFPDDEEYEDDDISELLSLMVHEPVVGIFPSSKRHHREWEEQLSSVRKRLASRAGLGPD